LRRDRWLRLWSYFRRGHSTYLVFLLSFANFIVIQYRLLVQYVPSFRVLFHSLLLFTVAFFLIYIPLAVVIGWYDYHKFSMPVELTLTAEVSPWNQDLARALILIAQGRNDEAVEILRRWVG